MRYQVHIVSFREWLPRLEHIFRQHYKEMSERLIALGVNVSPYNPRYEKYIEASDGGWLLTFALESEHGAVGYCNVYVTNDMHNGDLIAQEDAIYVLPEHRNGAGRMLARKVHEELRRRGVRRMNVTTSTDLRVSKWLERLGYKHTAHCMTINLAGQ